MDKNERRSYFYKGLTAFLVIASCVLFFFLIFKIGLIFKIVKKILAVLSPLIFGLVISYLVNPMLKAFDTKLITPLFCKSIKNKDLAVKLGYVISVFLSLIVFVAIIATLFILVIPQFITSISNVVTTLPDKLDGMTKWFSGVFKSNDRLESFYLKAIEYEKKWLKNEITPNVNKWAGYFASGVINVISFVKNFALGLVFAIYYLLSKKLFINQTRKFLFAIFNKNTVEKILRATRKSHTVFSGFISGKLLDSLIIGILCFAGVTILGIPYPMLVAVIVGVTNIIPVFGPYIGAIPTAALILMTNPIKGLYFIVFIILLQALDGNVIGPKILGDKTGLATFWVVFAIIAGGGLFGVVGMLIGVPAFAVIYYFIVHFVNKKLAAKGLPVNSDFYTENVLEEMENNDA